ncbi:methyl-accepting chemotaxis protein [Enterobacter kobei]|uniref:methyl-accepting chemotaxis protein n=1 Tax=Enterobacter kobei TaxID=208224 RepID=UPI003F4401AA
MNLTQIFRRIAQRCIPRQFGLLTGIFCIIGLFSALQLSSSFLHNASLKDAQRNERQNLLAYQQQSKLDLARVSLLAASDLLNRSGVWFMQDKETGSEGSWHSLVDEAQASLAVSHQAWQAWRALNPPEDEALVNSYQLFYGAIKEQSEALVRTHTIDAFFTVPAQAFQSDFNDNYARYQQASSRADEARQAAVGGDQMMSTVNASMQAIVERSSEMRGIVAMIDSVAFQTNILALNAAIEAAHAGNHGRGFAVVAREVGLLARKSSHSTQTIQELINRSLQGIEDGSRAVNLMEDNLQQVTGLVGNLSSLLNEISTATLSQGESIHQMTRQLQALNQVSRQTDLLVSDASEASERLQKQSDLLLQAVSRFRLSA